jgi:hypothetical protein
MAFWATKKFQLPFTNWGALDVNRKNLATIQHIPIVQWWLEMVTRHMFLESPC